MKKPSDAKSKKKAKRKAAASRARKKIQETNPKSKRSERAQSNPPVPELKRFGDEDRVVLARLAVDVWRMQQRHEDEAWVRQFVERFTDNLRELDVEIVDPAGTPFSDGDTIEVLHSEASEDWAGTLIVTRVIRPTIRVGDHAIQGQVVVGDSRSAEEETCQEK